MSSSLIQKETNVTDEQIDKESVSICNTKNNDFIYHVYVKKYRNLFEYSLSKATSTLEWCQKPRKPRRPIEPPVIVECKFMNTFVNTTHEYCCDLCRKRLNQTFKKMNY